jgi:YjjG family noncanonical pyrimidine nucleotidase
LFIRAFNETEAAAMIRAVFLDIDNTLLDFDAFVKAAMRDGFRKFGLGEYREDMFPVFLRINTEIWQEIEQGRLKFEEMLKIRWNRIFAALGITFDGVRFEDYFREYLFDCAIPVEGAAELLAYLKGKYILCAASNGPYDQQVNRLLRGGMLDCFSKLFISEQIGASKPSSKFFTHCLNELSGITPDEIIMIGDSLSSDMAGAIGMGMKTCYFDKNRSGKTGGMNLDYVVQSLDEIRSFL